MEQDGVRWSRIEQEEVDDTVILKDNEEEEHEVSYQDKTLCY